MYIIDVIPQVAGNLNQKKETVFQSTGLHQTRGIKKWFQDLTVDHKEAFLPSGGKEVNGTENKGENSRILTPWWSFSKLPRWQNDYFASALMKSPDGCLSEGGTGGAVAVPVQTVLQQFILIPSENSLGSKLHPRALPLHLSSTTLHHFPFSLGGTAWSWPQFQFSVPGMVTLRSAHTPDKPGAELSRESLNTL